MRSNSRHENKRKLTRVAVFGAVWAMIIAGIWLPFRKAEAAPSASALPNIYKRSAPEFDYNLSRNLPNVRQMTGEQLAALDQLKAATNSPNLQIRWNDFGGSPDVVYDFASQPFAGTPEEAGRAFIAQNSALFGVSSADDLRVFSQRTALGGHLIRFQQTFNGIPVRNGGIGIVMNANNRVIMASGPFFRNVNVGTEPALSAVQARRAADADINRFNIALPSALNNLLAPGLNLLRQQASIVDSIEPHLGIYPTADGYKLVWNVAKFSTNPFGLFMVTVDANTGEILARKDFVDQQAATPGAETADIYPKYPTITQELKDQGIISNCSGAPCGQERVTLRAFDPSNRVTGLNGTLTGTHALVNNALATKQPFAQAALGTWHFRQDNPTGFEARTNEIDHFAEPAEHQDEINAFFFVTYLLEYVDYLHIGGDNGTFGSSGAFPDDYPNKTIPLPATVHIPNVFIALDAAEGTLPNVNDPEFVQKALGLDNAFALNLTSIIESVTGAKSPVVVNPTSYGHGFLFNDLALEGTVPYHEGMHAITSPIAGLEGDIEGSALNEGQADMWAFTITDNPSLGDYVVNAHRFRQRYRDIGRNPDSVAYIRSAESTLKYSDIGTRNFGGGVYDFEEHYDGEIYMSTMWDIRTMFNRMYPNDSTYKRPQPKDGAANKKITKGTEIFERDFLGSMYILGTTSPDTLVKSRDAMIVADQMLYPSDSTDPASPGKHRAMIEQIFAAHELGVGARAVDGGKATISTKVTDFAGTQAAPAIPTNVNVQPASANTNAVSWNPVSGALAYEVLKRKVGFENRREPNGKRAFNDGDSSTTGYSHVAFVGGNSTSFVDKGEVHEIFTPAGLSNLFDHEYVVRAIGVNSTGQLGFSDFSGSSLPSAARTDVTSAVDSAISNVSFSNGVFAFDNKLTNARGAASSVKTLFGSIEFEIVSISNPTVTVRNADQGSSFIYNQSLLLGQTSNAKRIEFNDPMAQMFTFDAKVYANVFNGSTTGTGTSGGDGTGNAPQAAVYSLFTQSNTGLLTAGDPTEVTWGDPTFKGVTWDDVVVTTKSDAISLEATLSSVGGVDYDFELLTEDGQVITRSAGLTADEFVSASVQPNTTYILRILGYGNGPSQYTVVSTQLLPEDSPNANAGTRTTGGDGIGGALPRIARLVRFSVNPITKTVVPTILR